MKLTKLLAALFIAALLITPAASANVTVEPGDGAGSIIIKIRIPMQSLTP